ncbi:TlpA family protein disulfide reductase [Nocardia callitridis]|uniref:Methylamine utilization protein MauE n=1 Tax=Nocardia callitridis TaxID=648753 RepID=A0ABP9KKB0_9NOCA
MLIGYGVWISRLVLGAVFGLSAVGKLTDLPATRKSVADFGVPIRWGPSMAIGLPVVEAVVAVAVLFPWTAAFAALLAVFLLAVFTAAIARLLARGKRPSCSCFGSVSEKPIGVRTVVRNAMLAALALVVGVGAVVHPEVPGVLATDAVGGLLALAVLSTVVVWLFGQVHALRRRVDAHAVSALGAEGLPVGAVAPEVELFDTRDVRTTLESLLVQGRQVLLVFVHPGCELCAALARELPAWRARTVDVLTIVVVGNGDAAEQDRWGREQGIGEMPALVQRGNEAALRYRVRGTPSGVLIAADGHVLAPVARGAMAVRDLILLAKKGVRQ